MCVCVRACMCAMCLCIAKIVVIMLSQSEQPWGAYRDFGTINQGSRVRVLRFTLPQLGKAGFGVWDFGGSRSCKSVEDLT